MSLWEQMLTTLKSPFAFVELEWHLILAAVGLGLAFGTVWLAAYRPNLLSRPWLWVVGIISAFLTWTSIAFVQIPLQQWWWEFLDLFWPPLVVNHWLYLSAVPYILLSGIVQEAFKLFPVIVYRQCFMERFTVPAGIIAGAVAGAGFGIFEAVWVHNTIFASGWTWASVESAGFNGLLGFWERFFSIGLHISASALAGYGLAKGWGWQFYLLAALAHGISNYGVILLQRQLLTSFQIEMYIAVIAVVLTGVMLWLRWRRKIEADVMH
ncbi:MAG: hypothetical protein JXA46_04435 [Dehalococcoidales bacterium]|nr:hypothetical protein [Dehalococcoidales bacterium]